MYALRACKGNMQRAEDFVKKMEEGIKMKSHAFETLEKKKEVFALPNDEVQAQTTRARWFLKLERVMPLRASQALPISLFKVPANPCHILSHDSLNPAHFAPGPL
jgi:hypothetical protein